MHLQRGFENPKQYTGGYVSIGNFDGVHRGHQSMVAVLVRRARRDGVPAVVFTFDPHPIKLLRPRHAPPTLSTVKWKAELLARCGVDCVIAYPTDDALLDMTPRQFFDRIIRGELQARGLVEGPNFFFGRDRTGDIDTLQAFCNEAGMSLDVVPPVRVGDRIVSSSTIRAAIAAGRMAHAVELLGHPYRIEGRVVRGSGRGASLGFPTANLEGICTLIPADGVYAGVAHLNATCRPAAVSIGPNPTFGEQHRKVEVHLVDYTGDLYEQRLDVDLLDRIRGIEKYAAVEQLQARLKRDIEVAKRAAAAWQERQESADGC